MRIRSYTLKPRGVHEQKSVGNTALEGVACKSSGSFAQSTIPSIRCHACFYVA